MYCCTPKALYNHMGWYTITSVQHSLGWCDSCHRTMAPVRSTHTSYRWRGERVIEPIKCMLSPHTSYRWRGERDRANLVDGVGVLDWPENSPDLNPIEKLWVIVMRKMINKRPKNADELNEGHCQRNLGFFTTSAVPQTDHLHAIPNWGSN